MTSSPLLVGWDIGSQFFLHTHSLEDSKTSFLFMKKRCVQLQVQYRQHNSALAMYVLFWLSSVPIAVKSTPYLNQGHCLFPYNNKLGTNLVLLQSLLIVYVCIFQTDTLLMVNAHHSQVWRVKKDSVVRSVRDMVSWRQSTGNDVCIAIIVAGSIVCIMKNSLWVQQNITLTLKIVALKLIINCTESIFQFQRREVNFPCAFLLSSGEVNSSEITFLAFDGEYPTCWILKLPFSVHKMFAASPDQWLLVSGEDSHR